MWSYKVAQGASMSIKPTPSRSAYFSQDVKTLKLAANTTKVASRFDDSPDRAQFVCPLNMKEMNGSQPFVYLWPCGCVFSQAGLRAVSSTPPPRDDTSRTEDEQNARRSSDASVQLDICPQCATKYSRSEDIILLNPPLEEIDNVVAAMMRRRATEPAKGKGKKRKAAATASDAAEPPSKKKTASSAPSINPNIATASRAVANSLAEEEVKRKANMSEAVKSLYGPKDGVKRKETFMTMGTFTRVSVPFLSHNSSLIFTSQYA